MFVRQLALVSITPAVPFSEVALISAALGKQIARDFAPIWGINATVDAFDSIHDIPLGYWPS